MPPRKKDADFGISTEVKIFYLNPRTGNWTEKEPKKLTAVVAKAHDGVAIKVYKVQDERKPKINGVAPLKFHMIDLQSPILVTHLKPILEVEGVFLEETEVAHMAAPFKALFFCYDKILKSHDTAEGSKSQLLHPSCAMPNSSWDIPLPEMPQKKYADFDFLGIDTVLRQHLKLLVDLMDEMFGEDKARLKNMRASGLISYDLAWTYFRRDCTVFCGLQDTTRALRVTDTEYSKPPVYPPKMVIRCWEIAFDGEKFSWRLMNVDIPKFD
jgi:hypothetical protein